MVFKPFNYKILFLIGLPGKDQSADLFDISDKAKQKLIIEIANDERAREVLLSESNRAAKRTLTWDSYIGEGNFLALEIDEDLLKFPKYKNQLVEFIQSEVSQFNLNN